MEQDSITIEECLYRYRWKGQAAYINDGKVRFKTYRFRNRLLNIIIAILTAATTALIITLYLIYPVLHLVYDIGKPIT